MRRFRSAKIVATLGPASSSAEIIEKLFMAGVDVFRLNFSHGTHADHKQRHQIIRDLEKKVHRPIGILLDLQGPKLRIGAFKDKIVQVDEGQKFWLDTDEKPGDHTRVYLPHPEIFAAAVEGADLLLDDGKVRLKVTKASPELLETTVVVGGTLSDRKGLNAPSILLPISPMTLKDREDLAFGLEMGVDWIALSFVQNPKDVLEARELIGDQAGIVSKLEKPQAIEHLDEIVALSDAIMVARGDLGVEMPPEEVPIIQKRILRSCRKKGKPVIVCTQMLESMIKAPTPTRAEASDVATAIYDGSDAVMLSAESASGDYPIESVTIMNRIIMSVESDPLYRSMLDASNPVSEATTSDAITEAAQQVANTLKAATIVTFTTTGRTTLRASRKRPNVPILGLTHNINIARKLTLVWGVHSVSIRQLSEFSEAVKDACKISKNEGFAESGDRIVVTAGVPFNVSGSTNILRVARLKSDGMHE